MAWFKTKFFKNLIFLILILSAVYLAYALVPLIDYFSDLATIVVYPLILALILYYLFRPFIRLTKKRITVYGGLFIVYAILLIVVPLFFFLLYPKIYHEIDLLKNVNIEEYFNFEEVKPTHFGKELRMGAYFINLFQKFLIKSLDHIHEYLISNIYFFISTATNLVIILLATPFILFYYLKDDHLIYNNFLKTIPDKYKGDVEKLSGEFDKVLLHFITGRVIISFIINLLLLITFLIIGLKLVTIIIAISFFFYIIPSVGSFIAMIPALLIAFSQSLTTGWEVLIAMGVGATLEGFLVTPQVMGKELYIHPLTVLIILLISGYLLGFVGLLFSTPIYVLLKILLKHFLERRKSKAPEA